MNFQQLEYVVEINRYGSINKAAQALFVTQPTLSSAIKELEAEIGFLLFNRSKSGISATAEGQAFIASAETILAQVAHMRTLYTVPKTKNTPAILRFSSARYSFIGKALECFYKKHFCEKDQFSIYVEENHCHEVVEDVYYRRSEFGIIHIRDIEEPAWKKTLTARGMEYQHLFSVPSGVVFHKNHPLSKINNPSLEDIFAYPQICPTSRGSDYCNYDLTPGFPGQGEYEKNIYTNSLCLIYDLLSNTDAVFLATSTSFVTEYHPDLMVIPLPGERSKWSFFAVQLRGVPINPYASIFIKTLKDVVLNEFPDAMHL